MKKNWILAVVAAAVVFGVLAGISGCVAVTGMTVNQRISAFQSDIEAGNNTRKHFAGPGADGIIESTFTSSTLSPGNEVSFDSSIVSLGGDVYGVSYTIVGGLTGDAQLTMINVAPSGSDWYISSITYNIGDEPDPVQTEP